MAKNRLLDRQVKLLDYLTSGVAIFGRNGGDALDPALAGIDRGLLHLEARFSYEKRLAKIVAVYPMTFEILGDSRAGILREFVESCPPVDISRLVNARQFHDFLCRRWRRKPPKPQYLRDVAICEFACAQVAADVEALASQAEERRNAAPQGSFRRRPGVVLLRCAYDIRPIFEQRSTGAIPAKRETPIAITMPPGAAQPGVFEVRPAVFDLLAALDNWTDPAALGLTPGADALIHGLVRHGLVEVHE